MENTIHLLSSEVIDQIAAGEVVERPSHLVKELVENSLDAGATKISVEFSQGGRFVKVSDNGSGIAKNELKLALSRHATSKIQVSADLWSLQSFGFRGEALASIAAVSRLSLISKLKSQNSAAKITSDFGHLSEVEEISGSDGTIIQVEDLFSNVPARLKFMKSAASENAKMRLCLKALALTYFNVEFRILQDQELIFFWPARTSQLERAQEVLGVKNLYQGEAIRGNVRAYALFSDPETVQKTSQNLWFFAQNRWILDRSLQAAVMEAYRHLLMHGEYPIAAVWLETDPQDVDVNIHPTKSQVKFKDASLAFRAVQASIRDQLEKAPWLEKKRVEVIQEKLSASFINDLELKSDSYSSPMVDQGFQESLRFQAAELETTQYAQKVWQETSQKGVQFNSGPNLKEEQSNYHSAEPKGYWSQLQVLGQANLTYILTQSRGELMIIDQHAAHERVNFEKLMRAWNGGAKEVQEYLFPLAIDLSIEQLESLLREKIQLEKLGIQIEELGPSTIGVRSAPVFLKESALVTALQKMAFELVEQNGSFSLERKMGDLIATMACHSSVRAGQPLSTEEMKSLLKSMDEFPLSSFCPHGRPVSVEYRFSELEKDFGRTV